MLSPKDLLNHKSVISDNILKGFGIDIEKAGEGSKGGKVIGHTKSGKPIYESYNHSSHKDFSGQEHLEAFQAHNARFKDMKEGIKHLNKHEDMKPRGKDKYDKSKHFNKIIEQLTRDKRMKGFSENEVRDVATKLDINHRDISDFELDLLILSAIKKNDPKSQHYYDNNKFNTSFNKKAIKEVFGEKPKPGSSEDIHEKFNKK